MGKWTDDQLQYLREHSRSQPAAAIAAALGRTEGSVRQKRRSLGLQSYHAGWTKAEEQFLQDQWGVMSIPAIAKHLNRSVEAVIVRKNRLGLGPVLFGGDYISMNQLIIAVCGNNAGGGYKLKSWVENRGLPIHTKRVNQNSFRVIRLNEFWKWAEQNRSFIDFSKMEPLALGEEPAWVAEQRKKDFQSFAIQRKDPWTPDEDARLKMLLQQHRYGYAELSDILRRSTGAIQRRCTDLGIKERPVKADNHGTSSAWTQVDFDALADGIRHGDSYTAIGKVIGKSEKAIRGKVYFVYLTENQDKVRAMLKDQPWGYGAPDPTVKQAVHLSRTRTETVQTLEMLCSVLRKRINDIDDNPYWQRLLCVSWDEIKGCDRCENCDECTEFRRIPPQHCARCGRSFIERKENTFCPTCRLARKKKAQRHWCRVNGAQTRP